MSENKKLKVAFLWHMHQPFYFDPENKKFILPWVRLHALKDYLDMPLTAANHNVKATFNLVPSLLDQIELYCEGYTDRQQDLSRIPAKELTPEEKKEVLSTFFSAQYPTMIEPNMRYRQLFRKKESCGADLKLASEIFSSSELRDLQVWSNLVWFDPMFHGDEPIKELLKKGRDFSEEDKTALMDYQIELMKKIIPTYQRLYKEGKIDISFTPYYHPILPLLIDSQVAGEAIADIELPKNRFQYTEDARWHIDKSAKRFKQLFGKNLVGMWPSEGSVSEDALKAIAESGINWIATDEEILHQSLIKSGLNPQKYSQHAAYILESVPGTKIFFRDHGLSDKIGFVYSGWETKRAVDDFIQNLKNLKKILKDNLGDRVIPVILDGENAWEYYPDDATDFLNGLYQAINDDDEIEMVSFSDTAETVPSQTLSRLFSGSWINHNFRIWIGHGEDNAAWDLLYEARKALTEYSRQNPDADEDLLFNAWNQIYMAEGSDWCWWYGDDHIGSQNKEFDELYRLHISILYRILGLEIPSLVARPIHHGRLESFITYPETLITPQLDGLLTHYYEWSGAGFYNCEKAGGAMHRVDNIIRTIYFAYDYESLYIRLDFKDDIDLVEKKALRITIDFNEIGQKTIELKQGSIKQEVMTGAIKRIFELGIPRKAICEDGAGEIKFSVTLYHDNNLVEKWPADEPIILKLPEKDKEIFWQV